jgi:uncharacterized protein YkwD
MRNRTYYLLLCLILFSKPGNAQCSREQVVNDYNNIYLQSAVTLTQLDWTGNFNDCVAGTISTLAQTNTLARINYFRRLSGLATDVAFDAVLNIKCQEAALIMGANNTLTHSPDESWLCYTAAGAEAAGKSILALGKHSSDAINLYMIDNGLNYVGHRRQILYSRATLFGHGSTSKSDALWVIGDLGPTDVRPVTFPSAGFFPAPLVPSSNYWSFSLSGAGFSAATVSMYDEAGSPITITVHPVVNGYGDNTIVWSPTGIVKTSQYDVKYTVSINNVNVGGTLKNYTYDVILCQAVHPPPCPEGQSWSESECGCKPVTEAGEILIQEASSIIINPFSERLELRVRIAGRGNATVRLLDATGRLMERQTVPALQSEELILSWDTSSWSNGVYFIVIIEPDGSRRVFRAIKADQAER